MTINGQQNMIEQGENRNLNIPYVPKTSKQKNNK